MAVRPAWLVLCALAALPAAADEVTVISARPDAVSVTIYRDLFALITETRTVDLPAGPVTLVFDGVVDTLLPQSAVLSDVHRAVAEANYDFDRLTPANLLAKSIGRRVTLTRTHPATGRARQVTATLVAANTRGVIFQTEEGHEALFCSGLPEQLSFEEIPGELKREPQLSIHLSAGDPGKRQVRVSYLAHGFTWQANYVAQLGERMDLFGWITLHNLTGASFHDASVQVVAGHLNLLDADEDRGTSLLGPTAEPGYDEYIDEELDARLDDLREEGEELEPEGVQYFSGCYPMGFAGNTVTAEDIGRMQDRDLASSLQRVSGNDEIEEVVVTGFRASMAGRENLADYQMYRLPGRTDLLARQSKQVAFLHEPEVKYERFYSVRLESNMELEPEPGDPQLPQVKVAWINRRSDGLGEPLPRGQVRFFEPGPAGLVFIGDDRVSDSAVGAPGEFTLGLANDLALFVDNVVEDEDDEVSIGSRLMARLTRRVYLPVHLRVSSAKDVPVTFELRQAPIDQIDSFRVKGASLPTRRKAGDWMWRFTVPANGEATLSYEVGGEAPEGGF
jgi:hypothetical protein